MYPLWSPLLLAQSPLANVSTSLNSLGHRHEDEYIHSSHHSSHQSHPSAASTSAPTNTHSSSASASTPTASSSVNPSTPTQGSSTSTIMGTGGGAGYASSFLQNPYYFMFASLAKPDDDTELHWLKVNTHFLLVPSELFSFSLYTFLTYH